jgi:hypothetical protein
VVSQFDFGGRWQGLTPVARAPCPVLCFVESTASRMAFKIEIKPQRDTTGKVVHTVVVTIDDHETVLTFESQQDAELFAQREGARLLENGKNA